MVKAISERRGIAGAFYMCKIAGAACAEAKSLEEAERAVKHAQDNIRPIGVAVRAGSLPETGEPTLVLGEDEIEIGMGAHGEPEVKRRKLMPADELAEEMTRLLLADLPPIHGPGWTCVVEPVVFQTLTSMRAATMFSSGSTSTRTLLEVRGRG